MGGDGGESRGEYGVEDAEVSTGQEVSEEGIEERGVDGEYSIDRVVPKSIYCQHESNMK